MKKLLVIIACLISLQLFAKPIADSMFITTSDSVKLFVKRAGKGMPVVFIHGGPGSNSAYFEYEGGNIFERDVQMIYIDQRGCGRSENAANNDYSLGRMIKDFEEIRKALGYEQWVIMPHSFGGVIGTEYARSFPQSVKAMVLLNCTLYLNASAHSGIATTIKLLGSKLSANEIAYLQSDTVSIINRFFNAFWQLDRFGMKHALMFDKKQSAVLDSVITSQAAKHYEFGQKVWDYPEYFKDYTQVTSTIKIPVLVIGGTRDYTIGVDHPRLFKFPKMKVSYIGGGHALYLEHNAALYAAISPFLKEMANGL